MHVRRISWILLRGISRVARLLRRVTRITGLLGRVTRIAGLLLSVARIAGLLLSVARILSCVRVKGLNWLGLGWRVYNLLLIKWGHLNLRCCWFSLCIHNWRRSGGVFGFFLQFFSCRHPSCVEMDVACRFSLVLESIPLVKTAVTTHRRQLDCGFADDIVRSDIVFVHDGQATVITDILHIDAEFFVGPRGVLATPIHGLRLDSLHTRLNENVGVHF